ncbi:DNA-binding protein [Nocardia sp. NPDC051750]|uniref:DNA-binding protein n=1 Tax=Nocardia sp. NPDC051750 TaxID=3364325 RepID=UPI0037B6B086
MRKRANLTLPAVIERLNTQPTVSVEDTGKLLGVSRSTAYTVVANGEWPTIRVGHLIRIPSVWVRKQLQLDEAR